MPLSAGADGDWRCTITALAPDTVCHLAHQVLMDPREPCLSASGLFSRMHGSQSCLADTDMLPPCATARTQTFNSLWTSAMLEYVSIHNASVCATFVMLPPCALAHAHTYRLPLDLCKTCTTCVITRTHYNAQHRACRVLSLAALKRQWRPPSETASTVSLGGGKISPSVPSVLTPLGMCCPHVFSHAPRFCFSALDLCHARVCVGIH